MISTTQQICKEELTGGKREIKSSDGETERRNCPSLLWNLRSIDFEDIVAGKVVKAEQRESRGDRGFLRTVGTNT